MNLPAHIITCYPPSMNLPAHGIASPDPSIVSLLKTTHKQIKDNNIFTWLSLHAARQNQFRRLAVLAHRQALVPFQRHCFSVTVWFSTPCRQAPRSTGTSTIVLITWRHQQAARRHTRSTSLLVLAHSLICS